MNLSALIAALLLLTSVVSSLEPPPAIHGLSRTQQGSDAPIIIKPIESVVSVEDNVASFFCEAIANPKPHFQWTRHGKRVTGRRYTEIDMKDRMGSILRIEPLKADKDDGAEFWCEASNGVSPTATLSANLTVFAGMKQVPKGFPQIIHGPSSKVIERGTMFSLPCEATGNPTPTVTWLKDYAPIDLASYPRYRLFEDGRLQMDSAEDVDYGEYQCIATNKWGSIYSPNLAKIWVKVRRVPPHFSILPPTRVEVARGTETTKITCVAVGSPMPYVRWKRLLPQPGRNNGVARPNNFLSGGTIGDYVGADEMEGEDGDGEFGESEGERENTVVAVSAGSAPIGKNVLILKNVRQDANYSCVAASELGMIETATMVIVKDLPPPPDVIHISGITASSVQLAWRPPYNPHPNFPYSYAVELQKATATSGSYNQVSKVKIRNDLVTINASTTRLELDTLIPDTAYLTRLRTRTTVGLSEPSDYVPFRTLEAAPTTPPTSVGTKALTPTEVMIKWNEPEITNGKIKGYKIYYNHDEDLPLTLWPSLEVITQQQSDQQSLVLPNLTPRTIYTLRIAALNDKGMSPLSDPQKFFTQFGVPSQVPAFRGSVTSPYAVRLTWSKNLDWDIIDGYTIYYQDTKHGTQNSIHLDDPKASTYSISNLNADTLYHFKMVPRSGIHEGISTPTIGLKTHSTIPVMTLSSFKITAKEQTSTSVRIAVYRMRQNLTSNNDPEPNVEGFKLYWERVDQFNQPPSRKTIENSNVTENEETPTFAYFPNVLARNVSFGESGDYLQAFEHLISDLQPWTSYKIWVTPVLGSPIAGDGPPSVPYYTKTLEDVPGEPKNLSLKPINSTAIAVLWEPPEESQRNGEIMGYLIHFREVISKGKAVGPFQQQTIPDGTINQLILNDLKPESYYKVQVSAFTRKGDGYRSKAKVTRTMGGVPSAPTLSLRLLEEYPQLLVQAEWTRPTKTYGQLTGYKLTFKPLQNFGGDKMEGGAKGGLRDGSHVVELPGGNIYYYNVENLERGRSYQFTLSARNERGYGQSFVKIFDTPDGVPLNAPVNLTYKFQTPTTIQLNWAVSSDTATLNGPLVLYELLYYKESTSDDPYLYNTTSLRFAVRDLELGNVYHFKVRSYTRKGSGPWTDPLILHLGDKALPAVNRVRAYAISKTCVSLYWDNSKSLLNDVNTIKKYQVFYTSKVDQDYDNWLSADMTPVITPGAIIEPTPGQNSSRKTTLDEGGKLLTMDLKNLEPGTIYAIQIAAVSDRGLGLLSSPITTILTEPLVVPRDVRVLETSTHSLTIAWEAPIDIRPKAYQVTLEGHKNYTDYEGKEHYTNFPALNVSIHTAPLPTDGIVFKDLQPYTTYHVKVSAAQYISDQASVDDKMRMLLDDKPSAKLMTLTDFDAPPAFEWSPKVVDSQRLVDGIIMIKLPLASTENGPVSHYLLIVIPQVKSRRVTNKGTGIGGRSQRSTPSSDIFSMDELTYSNGYSDVEAPYVAAMFPTVEFPSDGIFSLGDDKFYHTFHNRPLSPGKLYRLFLRVFAGHFDERMLLNEGNTSRHFHSKYSKYTSSLMSEAFGLPLHPDLSSSYNLLTSQNGQGGPYLSLPERDIGREKMKLSKNKKMGNLSWPLKSLSLLIIAFSTVFSLLVLALLCYFFVFHRRRKSNSKRELLGNGIGAKKLADDTDVNGTERKKLLANNSQHHETSVIYSNAHNSVQTNCYVDKDYTQLTPYEEDTIISNDKIIGGAALAFKSGSLLSAISKKSSQDKQHQHGSQYNTKSLTRRGKVSAAGGIDGNAIDSKPNNAHPIGLSNLPPDPVATRRYNYRTTAMSTHPPVSLKELPEYITKLKANDNSFFSQEYESIDPGQVFTWEHSSKESNKCRNRYANVVAYDHTRVILNGSDANFLNDMEERITNDYINANFIDGYRKPCSYIATQGPLPETVGDFWRMIWEQNTCIIVMLTKLEERARIKCDQYWPSRGTTEFYGKDLQNTMVDSMELATYTIRTFSLNKVSTNELREVKQYQFTAWPDHGVPDYPTPFLYFLKRVKAANPLNAGPLVVHCSAGVGRTGTFIVIDSMIERMRVEDTIDVYGHVTLMRAQRNFMVQTEDQYIFIYDSILEAYECGDTEISAVELSSHIQKLNAIQPGETMTGMEYEFKKLSNQKISPAKFVSANFTVNKYKNRLVNILPFESNRVCLFPIRGIEGSDYINASFIDGYRTRNAYIATQGPLAETIEDFWRMLWEHNSNIIVMLTKLRENGREKSAQYWPIDCSVRYGRFVIEPVAEYTMPQYTLREFKVTDAKGGSSMPSNGTLGYHHNGTLGLHPYTQPLTTTVNTSAAALDDNCYASFNISSTAPMIHPSAHGSLLGQVRGLSNTSTLPSASITTTRTIRQFQFDYPIEEEFNYSGNSGSLRKTEAAHPLGNVSFSGIEPMIFNNGSAYVYDGNGINATSTVPRPSTRTLTSSPAMSERKNIMIRLQSGPSNSIVCGEEADDSNNLVHHHDSSLFLHSGNMNGLGNGLFTPMDPLGNNGLEEVFVDFIGQVHKTKEQFGLNGPITVHCGAGVGRTGVFIACSIALERMRYEGSLDVFQTVRALRTQRLGMVQTESQYKFCYRAALQYLRSFDMYTS